MLLEWSKHPSRARAVLSLSSGVRTFFFRIARIASVAAPGDHCGRVRVVVPGDARSFHRPLAGGQVYHEEYVELDQRRQYEEDGVHAQAGAAHLPVQLEPVGGERDVEQHQRRQQRYSAVLQPAGIDADVVSAGLRGREGRLDQPG